jgi:hypothetical protein
MTGLIFEGSKFTCIQVYMGINFSGTFSVTDTTITFTPDPGVTEKYFFWTQNYTITNNVLYIEDLRTPDDTGWFITAGEFIKQ